MSAFITKTYTWVNIPKMAGKYGRGLKDYCGVKYKVLGKGHKIIPIDKLPQKTPIVVAVRHPITFLSSLYMHRQSSRKPWQRDELETGVGVDDWDQFINNVIDNPGWVKKWWHRWIDPYPQDRIRVLRVENIWNEWTNLWDELGQSYDKQKAISYRDQQINRDPRTVRCLEKLSQKQIDDLWETQQDAFSTYGYEKNWRVIEYKAVPKLKKKPNNKRN